jgi:RimJ/RimL family protein N-acetyltransferase
MSAEKDAVKLFPLVSAQESASIWTYMFDNPPETPEELQQMMTTKEHSTDPVFYTIDIDGVGPVGWASLMRIDEKARVVELGHILFSSHLQRTRNSTRVMYLFLRHAFETLGYRRVEWKCDSLNAPSRSAAQRLGFRYEGIFRQHMIYKGRSRDTAWFSILDGEWPAQKAAFDKYLSADNFDGEGKQIKSLAHFSSQAKE